jgi:hypothetical protein
MLNFNEKAPPRGEALDIHRISKLSFRAKIVSIVARSIEKQKSLMNNFLRNCHEFFQAKI